MSRKKKECLYVGTHCFSMGYDEDLPALHLMAMKRDFSWD